ncbi:protein of unknown function [Candidatus Nitrosocosmicus franklandus]|uniref:Uncharacterized protein n=1 Tax=Candidatus Nitrosocosmicus franklandianus TaxID=1798806 RepID=A0A484IG26_9ARCH|nr:protein of unknown function [Candidatus Nitrosocosmicus franklandus]
MTNFAINRCGKFISTTTPKSNELINPKQKRIKNKGTAKNSTMEQYLDWLNIQG